MTDVGHTLHEENIRTPEPPIIIKMPSVMGRRSESAMAGAPHELTSNLVEKNAGKNCSLHIYVANKDVRQLQCLKVEVQT